MATVSVVQSSASAAWKIILAFAAVALTIVVIAAMVVLSLIPLYVPNKDISSTTYSAVYRIKYINAAPDGVTRKVITINDKYPAPNIFVNRGDTISIKVINEAGEETAMHWHGLLQRQTTYMDGVPGVTQCPIEEGGSYVYTFSTSDQAGTYWYHSHSAVQLGDGLQGALIIRDRKDPWRTHYTSEDVLLLTEWYHTPAVDLLVDFLKEEMLDPIPQSGLINGIGQYNCTPGSTCSYYRTLIRPGMTKRLRIINTSLYSKITFTIDQHEMKVIEVDGMLLDGTKTVRKLRMNPAQRYSVLVVGKKNPGATSYWMRSTIHKYALDVGYYVDASQPNTSAILQYVVNNNYNPSTVVPSMDTFNNDASIIEQSVIEGELVADEVGLVPLANANSQQFPVGPPTKTIVLDLVVNLRLPLQALPTFNNQTFTHPAGQTLLAALLENNMTNLYIPTSYQIEKGDVVDLVINNYNMYPHPMHLHGHEKWLLAAGSAFDGAFYTAATVGNIQYNTVNPTVRDTISVNPFSYVALRFKADNPGIWVMHCHNDWHLNLGMALVFIESPNELKEYLLSKSSSISIERSCHH